MALEHDDRYRALREGDARLDGRFFAGVVTTGVYCRSICPVPNPPKHHNVRFYPSAAAAQAAGFRACMICHPERAPGPPPWSALTPVVSRALRLIGEGALDGGSIEDLAGRLGMTSRHLRRLFETELGAPPVAIAKATRTHFARRLLDETTLPMTEVAHAAGFGSIRQFNQDMRAAFGRPPTELRRRRVEPAADDGAIEVRLPYRPPLDWARAIRFLQGRATPGVEVAEHDRYRRTIEVDGAAGAIEIRVVAHEPHLLLRAWLPSNDRLIHVAGRARRLFDCDADPLAIAGHLRRSPVLARAVRARPGLRVPQAWDPFEAAVRAILGQQVSVRAATTIATRLVHAFGKPAEIAAMRDLTHVFPAPHVLADADLSGLGMTGAQARAIAALAREVAGGTVTLDAARGLDDFVERLCALPGIGPWTAHYVAMRALGEPDAFPASDLGVRRALAGAAGLPSQREAEAMAEAWRPWRSYAVMYLWNAATKGATR